MKKEKEKTDLKKAKYLKPVLTKHKKLRDITAESSLFKKTLGCTKL